MDGDEAMLRIRIEADALDGEQAAEIMARARDRIAAASGSVTVETTAARTTITAEFPVRVVIAEDMALLRQGLARLLTDAGFDVVGGAGDADELLEIVARAEPDAALIDIKMPPTHTDEGLRAAAVDS